MATFAEDVRDAAISFPGVPLTETVGNLLKQAIPPTMFGVIIYDTPEQAIAGLDYTDQLNAYHNYCISAGVMPNERIGYVRAEKTVNLYSNGNYGAQYVSRNAANFPNSTTKRGPVWTIAPAPGNISKYNFKPPETEDEPNEDNGVVDNMVESLKQWGNTKRHSSRITNMTLMDNQQNPIDLVGKVISIDVNTMIKGQATGEVPKGDLLLGRGSTGAYRQGACFYVNNAAGQISHKLMSTWDQSKWWDGDIWIETPGPRMSIKPPSVYLYGPGNEGSRESVASCGRSKTHIEGFTLHNYSPATVGSHFSAARCVWISLEAATMEEAGWVSQQYGANFGLVSGLDIFAGAATGNRRDIDAHRSSDITIFGGNFPNGIGCHYGARYKVIGSTIGCGDDDTSHNFHVSGGDFQFIACNVSLNGRGKTVFNVREDAWELWGAVIFTACTIDIDLTGMGQTPKIFDFRGGATASNSRRDIFFPDLVSMDESNRINIRGSGAVAGNPVMLMELFSNINTELMPFKINTSGRMIIAPQVKFLEGGDTMPDGTPRLRVVIVKPSQQIGTGYDIEFRGLPGVHVQANAAQSTDVNTIARHNFRFVRCNHNGVATSKFKYGAGVYRDAHFIDCPGIFEQLVLTPTASWLPIGDEDRSVSAGFAREDLSIFPENGTWKKPYWAKTIDFVCHGGGGGGGSGATGAGSSSRTAGAGGGAGALNRERVNAANCPDDCTVTVGVGGSGGTANSGTSAAGAKGGNGGFSQVAGTINSVNTILIRANGGEGGNGGSGSTGVAGGVGGQGVTMEPVGDGSASAPGTGSPGIGSLRGAGGGGPGGGISNANGTAGGRSGGAGYLLSPTRTSAGGALGVPGAAGGNGTNKTWDYGAGGGGGGGGAGPNDASAGGGKGGNGGFPAAGGGGGGAASNGAASGAGGNGGRGEVWITCRS